MEFQTSDEHMSTERKMPLGEISEKNVKIVHSSSNSVTEGFVVSQPTAGILTITFINFR